MSTALGGIADPHKMSICGVPVKEVMIDAIVGANFPTRELEIWAENQGLARFSGNQWNEAWSWNRKVLEALDLEALFAIYSRQKVVT